MSHSYRHMPIAGLCADSDKEDKVLARRAFRRREHVAVAVGAEPPFDIRQVSDVWGMAKDGKVWLDPSNPFSPPPWQLGAK